jgi:MFS family permease
MTLTTQAPAPARAFDPAHRTITVGLLALVTMFAFEAVAVSLAMPTVARALDGATLYPVAVVGLITAAIVGMVLGAVWSDARGPALPVTAGGLGFAAGLLLSGLAGSMELFVAGRLVQGLTSGAAMTAMYVAVGDAYPTHLRTRVFSLFATAWVLPAIVGPFVAGALVDLVGWRSVFLVVAGFALVSTLVVTGALRGHLLVREAPLVWGRRPAYALLAAVGVLALHLAGHDSGGRLGVLLVVGLAALGLSVGVLLPRGTVRAAAGLPAVVATRGVFGAAFVCAEMFIPLVLQTESGYSPTAAGLVLMVGALGWSAGSSYAGKHGRPDTFDRLLRLAALALLAGAAVTVLLVLVDHLPLVAGAVATMGFAAMAVGMGLGSPLTSTLALDLAPQGRQGESGSAIQMSDALGQSVAAGLVGAAFARWFVLDQQTSYLAGFGLAVALGALAVAVTRRCLTGCADDVADLTTADRTPPPSPSAGLPELTAARSPLP